MPSKENEPESVKYRMTVDFVVKSSAFAKGYGGRSTYVIYALATFLEIALPFGTSWIQKVLWHVSYL
ncbi:MAG: hypothetical protein J6X55_12490 [Victivallales bacterium]|nr:hypothetical protein [Victivallales bacterium]